jgi:hypothetical protein
MNNKAYLGSEIPAGWAIGWARVANSGEAEMEAHLTHFEKNRPHDK